MRAMICPGMDGEVEEGGVCNLMIIRCIFAACGPHLVRQNYAHMRLQMLIMSRERRVMRDDERIALPARPAITLSASPPETESASN